MKAKVLISAAAIVMLVSCAKDKGTLPNNWQGLAGSYVCNYRTTHTYDDWHDPFPPVTTVSTGADTIVIEADSDPNSLIFFAGSSRPLRMKINSDSTFSSSGFNERFQGRFINGDSITMLESHAGTYESNGIERNGHK